MREKFHPDKPVDKNGSSLLFQEVIFQTKKSAGKLSLSAFQHNLSFQLNGIELGFEAGLN